MALLLVATDEGRLVLLRLNRVAEERATREHGASVEGEALGQQIERLSKVILEEFPDEPGRMGVSEGAVDVAIRLIKQLKLEHTSVKAS